MIAKGFVRGALPALGQLQTPATIARGARLSKEFVTEQPLDLWFLHPPPPPRGCFPAAEIMSQQGGRRGSRVIRRQADPDRRERRRSRTGSARQHECRRRRTFDP